MATAFVAAASSSSPGATNMRRSGGAISKTPEEAAEFCETPDGAAFSGCWYLATNGCLPFADAWDIDAITRRVNGDAMEAAGLRRQYSDEMLSRLREYAATVAQRRRPSRRRSPLDRATCRTRERGL